MNEMIGIGNKIEMQRMDSEGVVSDKLFTSKILDIREAGILQIAMPIDEGHMVPLAVNDRYYVWCYCKQGLYVFEGIIRARYKENGLYFMDFSMETEAKKIQRRAYYRYSCKIGVQYRIVPEDEEDALTLDEYELQEWKKAIMLDLSGGGIKMVANDKLEEGSLIQIRFYLPEGDELKGYTLYASLIKSSVTENNRNLYELRSEFQRIGEREREDIIRYIFEEERKQRAKEKGMM